MTKADSMSCKKQILMVWRQDFSYQSHYCPGIIRNRDITDIDEFDKYLNGSLKGSV